MLAHHLKRLAKPVRYAMDPAHEQAIRNYLAIASRAQELPRVLPQGLATPQAARLLGSQQPHAQEAARTMFSENDPTSLMALVDLLHEQGMRGDPHSSDSLTRTLYHLQQLHHNIAGYGQGQAGAHPAVLRGYGDEALNNRDVRRRVSYIARDPMSAGGYTPLEHVMRLNTLLGQQQNPRHFTVSSHLNDLMHAHDPRAAIKLHDIGNDILHDDSLPSRVGNHGAGVAAGMGELLKQLHPSLWHFGEHGTLPQ